MNEPTEDAGTDIITAAIDAISGTDIPAPIKKSFFKAVGQLCTAAVEIPVAYMEGIAQERGAETQARIKLIEKSSNEIAEQMQFNPEYARAAVKKFGQRVVREQINLDRITHKAADALTFDARSGQAPDAAILDAPTQAEQKTIDDDWLNVFEKEASQKSTEEMQGIFAKLLAGEIRRPTTYSIKSVRLLGSMDQGAAGLFKRFCSKCIALKLHGPDFVRVIDARVPSLNGNAASNALRQYGLSFDDLNTLQEYGLIIADYNSRMDYTPAIVKDNSVLLPFEYATDLWALGPMEGFQGTELKISGVALTRSGKELMNIVDIEADPKFTQDMITWFEARKLKLMQVRTKR